MKQLFCDIEYAAEEKPVEITLRVAEPTEPANRWHYCLERRQITGFQTSGVPADSKLFCPLCGALTTTRAPDVRPGENDRQSDYDGPRCEHGYPDATCADLVNHDDSLEYTYRCAIPQFRAAALVPDPEPSAALGRWARPCPLCRDEFLASHYGLVEHGLQELCATLARRSASAAAAVSALQSDLNLVHALLADLPRVLAARSPEQTTPAGYVYAVTDDTAIKIGWSNRHPGAAGGRLSQLQTAHHAPLKLLGAVPADAHLEAQLHARFAEYRIRGEWFRYAAAIVEYFDSQ